VLLGQRLGCHDRQPQKHARANARSRSERGSNLITINAPTVDASYITSHVIVQIFRSTCLRTFLFRSREDIVGLESVGRAVGTKDLPALALPLWLVDRIDPILNFHDDASVLLHKCSATLDTLG
jgi:hypothetical protein